MGLVWWAERSETERHSQKCNFRLEAAAGDAAEEGTPSAEPDG